MFFYRTGYLHLIGSFYMKSTWGRICSVHTPGNCIARNQSSALFVFPSQKIIMSLLCLIEKAVVNPVRCIDVPLGGVNLSPG
jgi:hypothetical protein